MRCLCLPLTFLEDMLSFRLEDELILPHIFASLTLAMSMLCSRVPCNKRPPHAERSSMPALGVLSGKPFDPWLAIFYSFKDCLAK